MVPEAKLLVLGLFSSAAKVSGFLEYPQPARRNSTVFSCFDISGGSWVECQAINTLRTGSFKLFKRPLLGFLTILTL